MFVTNFELFCSAGLGPPRSLEMSVSEKGRKLKAKKLPFAPSPSKALVKGELYQLRRTGFKRVTVLIAADQHDVWCIWGESLRLPIACIREISITKLHALEFRIDTFVNGTHVFRAPQRPGALHYWVATLQTLCAQCMEPASRWRIVWAVSRVQARWRGLLGRKRAEMEQRKRASAEADKLSAAERSRIANQAAQVARDERAQVPPPRTQSCNAPPTPATSATLSPLSTIAPPAPWQDTPIGTRSVQLPKTAEGLGMKVRYKRDTGVIVWTVEVDRAAWTAGLRVGDVLQSVEGQVLDSIDHLLECLEEVEVGGVINMEVRGP